MGRRRRGDDHLPSWYLVTDDDVSMTLTTMTLTTMTPPTPTPSPLCMPPKAPPKAQFPNHILSRVYLYTVIDCR